MAKAALRVGEGQGGLRVKDGGQRTDEGTPWRAGWRCLGQEKPLAFAGCWRENRIWQWLWWLPRPPTDHLKSMCLRVDNMSRHRTQRSPNAKIGAGIKGTQKTKMGSINKLIYFRK